MNLIKNIMMFFMMIRDVDYVTKEHNKVRYILTKKHGIIPCKNNNKIYKTYRKYVLESEVF